MTASGYDGVVWTNSCSNRRAYSLCRGQGLHLTVSPVFWGHLSVPYLRAHGIAVNQIDDDAFAIAAFDEYRKGKYRNLQGWLKRQRIKSAYQGVEYDHLGGPLTFKGAKTKLVDLESDTYRELKALKKAVSKRGIFRYGDMYYFANRYLNDYSWAAAALQRRFDVLLLDEMQDTSSRQELLLERIFPPDRVEVQRFGDINQAIFEFDSGEECETSFPRDPILYLGSSRRFGAFIAANVAAVAPRQQVISGEDDAPDSQHTIFLFDESTVDQVVTRFAGLAAKELKHLTESPVVRVIGTRRRASENGGKFPHSLGDYADPRSITISRGVSKDRLIVAVAQARAQRSLNSSLAAAELLGAQRRLIGNWLESASVSDVVGKIMRDWTARRELGAILDAFWTAELNDERAWTATVAPLIAFLERRVGKAPTASAIEYLEYVEGSEALVSIPNDKGLPVPLKIETIHAVKGQTHHATLVLETQFYEHDVSLVLPLLADPTGERKSGGRFVTHCRRLFVAMSRPSNLLCLAAAASQTSAPLRFALERQGWTICDLTSEGKS